MHVMISKAVAETVGVKKFVPFGIPVERWKSLYGDSEHSIDLLAMKRANVRAVRALFEPHKDQKEIARILRNIDRWLDALDDAGGAKARTEDQFEAILTRYIAVTTKRRLVYEQDGNIWWPYYVGEVDVEYLERREKKYVAVELFWHEFGVTHRRSVAFWDHDFRGMAVREALARKGFVCESDELRAQHDADLARFNDIAPRVGLQCLAVGSATDDCDGNGKGRSSSWYWSQTNTVVLGTTDAPRRVVVDVFYEDPKENRHHDAHPPSSSFWDRITNRMNDAGDGEADEDVEMIMVAPPVHPVLAVFDLARHLRVRAHVNQLTPYVYDVGIAEKLVLPEEQKRLVGMLVESKGGAFRDIVAGKSGGAVVLLAGPPGVGKTLTAEVYAEAEQRPLYSVQCSQLGIDPEHIEDELLKVFARAKRWSAVTLLDEADVYVHERGADLTQNAIVGVFLRVLEYQSTVLFLTTNRPDDVDDAIASRCVARLTYDVPTTAQQARIWRVLSASSGIPLDFGAVEAIVRAFPKCSGRDIKNLLKLAAVVAPGEPVTADAVAFAHRFRPTLGTDGRRAAQEASVR